MSTLTLELAIKVAEGAIAKGRDAGFNPMSIAVLDAGGHLVSFMRDNNSGILRAEIATGKAYGALGFGIGSRSLSDKHPPFLNAVAAASGGRMVPVPGGVLIRDGEGGAIIGAAGISGDTSDNDEIACIAGIEAAGFSADPGQG
jgi:uncharacterized protein GlcG (DUF336 family)